MTEANLIEIYSSVQGEGTHLGETTLFVRFGGCDLRCRWCDSPHTWSSSRECRIERGRGSGEYDSEPNPIASNRIVAAAEQLGVAEHRFVSFTGGEPLLQPEPLLELARELRSRGPRIHLETHGVAASALETVVAAVDVVAMDWKLASEVRRASDPRHGPVESFHEAHSRFLKVAQRAPEVVVKLVVTPSSTDDEIDEMCERIAHSGVDVTLIVQPVTPFGGVRKAPDPRRLLALVHRLSARLPDVRLIPQTHKVYGAP